VNVFARLSNIDQQLALMGANADVLLAVFNVHEFRFGILLQFFSQCAQRGQPRPSLCDGVLEMTAGDHMHGHGHDGGRNPDVNVPPVIVIFIDAHHAFVKSIDARHEYSAAEA